MGSGPSIAARRVREGGEMELELVDDVLREFSIPEPAV